MLKLLERLFNRYNARGYFKFISDELCLKILYHYYFDEKLDLNNPITYNQKLQWLKLNDRKDIYTTMVDKEAVKKYVANIIGEEFIIPTLGVWDNFDEINFRLLPNQFVLKCTHDSGSIVICRDKDKFDKEKAHKSINKGMKRNLYWSGREWPYKNVKPRIIAEKFMLDKKTEELKDYKFYCFDGKVKVVVINSDRNTSKKTKGDFYDRNFNYLDFQWGFEHAEVKPGKPELFDDMIRIAEKLSKGIPEVRIDLYYCNGKIYFGEYTFFDGSGMTRFEPKEWDYKMGTFIKLPR